MVKGKLFREDLLHRINVIKIDLPPLRERSEDIETLIKYYLNQFSKEYKISLKNLDSNVLNILKDYSWPGNVRQLQNICKYLTIMSSGNNILVDDLPKEIFEASEKLTINSSWQDTFKSYLRSEYKKGSVDITKITDADYEECLIKFAMEICNGKKIEAAKLLGWGRNTIANKIKNIT
jgi:two-component system nitrogen regulation response regulator GlnG